MRSILPIIISFLILSCTATKSSADSSPKKKDLKGTWQISDIRFVGEDGLYKANLFSLANSTCFKESEWVFIPNNATGKFTLNASGSGCESSEHRIVWSLFESGDGTNDFQFKFVDQKNRPLSSVKSGYRLKIMDLSPTDMKLSLKTTDNGKPFDVVLTYNKVSDIIEL